MALRHGVLGVAVLAWAGSAAGPAPAQDNPQIQAEDQQVLAEVRAYQQAIALRDQRRLDERLSGIRSLVEAMDRCLAAGQRGELVQAAYGDCHTTTWGEYRNWLAVQVGGGAMSPAGVVPALFNAHRQSQLNIQLLHGQRAQLIAEFNADLAKLNQLRGGRGAVAAAGPGQAGPLAGACMLGAWQNRVKTGGYSVWTIGADGSARESGLGNGYGQASASGHMLTIRWKTDGGYTGHYTIAFDGDCQSGQGMAVQETAPAGVRPTSSPTTWTR